ncbi:MAG: MFS transporter [Spirulina sp. SIO3F2]|nr:MFS transporter [Spirulina sp. SIO3F2]
MFGAALCFWSSLTILLPTLPLYIEARGATQQQVGLVMGSFAIGLLLTRGLFGRWADEHSRKRVLLIGTVMVGLAPLGYSLAHSLALLMVLRAAHGLSIAGFTTGYSSLVIDLAPRSQRGEILGYMTLVIPFGMALGPAIGSGLEQEYGFGMVFAVAGGLGLLAFTGISLVREAPHAIPDAAENRTSPALLQTLLGTYLEQLTHGRRLQIPALVLMLAGMVFGTLIAFLPAYARDSPVSINTGLFYTAVAIASFTVRVVAGKASDRIGRGLFITGSLILYVLSMILLAIATEPLHFILAALAEGAAAGILLPMMIALVADRTPAHQRGQAYAVCVGGFDLGIALGGPIMGSLVTVWGYRGAFGTSAAVATLGLLVFLTQSSPRPGRSLRFAFGRSHDEYAQAGS